VPIVIKRPIRGQRTLDDIERFEEARLHLLGRHADQPNLYRIGPARQADLQPAFAEVIEHRNLFGKTGRMVHRRGKGHDAHAQTARPHRHGSEKNIGRLTKVVGEMMFAEEHALEIQGLRSVPFA